MGVNVDVKEFFQKFESNLMIQLTQAGASTAIANCNITIRDISFASSTNCSIEIINNCIASSAVALDSVIRALSDAFTSMSAAQQTAIAAFTAGINVGVQTTSLNFVQNMTTLINQRCNSTAVTNSDFSIGTIKYGTCRSLGGNTTIRFVNTGQATANCAIKTIGDLQLSSVNNSSSTQGSEIGGFLANIRDFFTSFGTTIVLVLLGIIFIPTFLILFIKLLSWMIKKASSVKLKTSSNVAAGTTIQPLEISGINQNKSKPSLARRMTLEDPFIRELALKTISSEPLHWSLYSKFM